jgi:hypothetical protein
LKVAAMLATLHSDKVSPFTSYPSGMVGVVFSYMLYRPYSTDSWELRDEFRRRLNEVTGVDLPSGSCRCG